jgi:hypothetical protein
MVVVILPTVGGGGGGGRGRGRVIVSRMMRIKK